MQQHPSPNHDARPAGQAVDILLLHYTGMRNRDEALARLCDSAAAVSAHYLIDESGDVFALVPEERRAWHAGLASWRGASDINARSIGIELENPGHEWGYRAFPEAQMQALELLARAVVDRHDIPRQRVLGHSDVAPVRKRDPGELFDWGRLAKAGLGLWPAADFAVSPHAPTLEAGMAGPAVLDLQTALDRIGYAVEGHALYDPVTEQAVLAFQRHFRQASIDGIADAETVSLAHHLAELSS
jgi:N-acetylmuramoyl-L-alanine amidase